jgi:hypothetical protein
VAGKYVRGKLDFILNPNQNGQGQKCPCRVQTKNALKSVFEKKKSQISIPASICLDLYESIFSYRK